jgi:hypothetical protein
MLGLSAGPVNSHCLVNRVDQPTDFRAVSERSNLSRTGSSISESARFMAMSLLPGIQARHGRAKNTPIALEIDTLRTAVE